MNQGKSWFGCNPVQSIPLGRVALEVIAFGLLVLT